MVFVPLVWSEPDSERDDVNVRYMTVHASIHGANDTVAVYAPLHIMNKLNVKPSSYVVIFSRKSVIVSQILQDEKCNDSEKECVKIDAAIAFHLGVDLDITFGHESVQLTLMNSGLDFTPLFESNFMKCSLASNIAKRVILSRVRTPSSSGFRDYSTALTAVFGKPRILRKNQIIKVESTDGEEPVYFQCTEIEGITSEREFAIVHKNVTILETSGSVNARLPHSGALVDGPAKSISQLFLPMIKAFDRAPELMGHLSCKVLLTGSRRSGKRKIVQDVSDCLGAHLFELNSFDIVSSMDKQTSENLRDSFSSACEYAPVLIHLRRISAFKQQSAAQGRDSSGDRSASNSSVHFMKDFFSLIEEFQITFKMPILFVASTTSLDEVMAPLRSLFTHEIAVKTPEQEDRERLMSSVLDDQLSFDFARKTAGLTFGEVSSLCVEVLMDEVHGAQYDEGDRKWNRAQEIFKVYQARLSDSLGSKVSQIPTVKWDDVGGLDGVKDEIKDAIDLPVKHANLFGSEGVKPRAGLLLYGPPGTGKTLIAKAIATECSFNFMSVKGPELLNMYVGESEANVRQTFERARAVKPCVLFFDELDSLAPFRGNGSDGGGVMDRVVAQLLTELDGLGNSASLKGLPDIFVVGATNRPDLLDPALLRPGRLDRCLYLGISVDKYPILKALTRKFELDKNTDLRKIAESCPRTFTGADMYALCSDAILNATKRKVKEIDSLMLEKERAQPHSSKRQTPNQFIASLPKEQQLPIVEHDDFLQALSNLTPSVSEGELAHYEKLKLQFSATSEYR